MTTIVAAFVLTAGMVAEATGGRLAAGPAERVFAAVSIDSRSLPADALFIALRGTRFDGHAFVEDVIARGAAGVLVSRGTEVAFAKQPPSPLSPAFAKQPPSPLSPALAKQPPSPLAPAVIVVEDTLAALQRLGREVRVRSGARVVAITGSAGKTTTKEVTAEFLSGKYRVFRNPGNLNNQIGLPLSLLELRHAPDVAVVELGMNHPGEVRTLVRLAEPEVRVWTNVGDAHIGYFASRESIAEAKAEILENAAPDSLLVANADDALVMAHAGRFAGRRLTFGETDGADVRATHVVDRGFDGTSSEVRTPHGPLRLTVALAGRAQLSNVLAGVAVALEFAVPIREIEIRAAGLRPVDRRGAVCELPNGARLVDDSYNASPAATRAMLAALQATPTRGRRIAVIGEMLELGERSYALHETCGRASASAGVDELVAIGGPAADGLSAGAAAGGLPPKRIHRFATSETAASAMLSLVRAGDLVLVKGSRATRTDVVADRLKAGV